MNTKLQELTDKIYLEGVEKGNADAQAIREEAHAEALRMIEKARAEAAQIVSDATLKSEEILKNTKSELKLFAQQSVNALKSEIAGLLCGEIVSQSVKAATADKEFMQKVILTMAQEWGRNESLVIQASDAAALRDYFAAKAKVLLDNGLKIEQSNGAKSSFTISPAAGGYKVTIGEEELIAYFREFLRPQLAGMLF